MKRIVAGLLLAAALVGGIEGFEQYLLPTEARFAEAEDQQNWLPTEARMAQVDDQQWLPTEARQA
jgi:hypothetical protein